MLWGAILFVCLLLVKGDCLSARVCGMGSASNVDIAAAMESLLLFGGKVGGCGARVLR